MFVSLGAPTAYRSSILGAPTCGRWQDVQSAGGRPTETVTSDQAKLLALCRPKGVNWLVIAREAQRPDGLARLLRGEVTEDSREAKQTSLILSENLAHIDDIIEEVTSECNAAFAQGARLTTVLEDSYPLNLRAIHNLPPFLMHLGDLRADDTQAVAVVGTRHPSMEGISRAESMARNLVERGITVLSGLAAGIDTAAHTTTLATGGRTVAVIGTGILRSYPAQNKALQRRIAEAGCVVSQFWPTSPPLATNFPLRNIVMSGLGQGTVVIEATHTSGARMQARYALEHGKKVFLPRILVEQNDWAKLYSARPGAFIVDHIDDIVQQLKTPEFIKERNQRREQLSLGFA